MALHVKLVCGKHFKRLVSKSGVKTFPITCTYASPFHMFCHAKCISNITQTTMKLKKKYLRVAIVIAISEFIVPSKHHSIEKLIRFVKFLFDDCSRWSHFRALQIVETFLNLQSNWKLWRIYKNQTRMYFQSTRNVHETSAREFRAA